MESSSHIFTISHATLAMWICSVVKIAYADSSLSAFCDDTWELIATCKYRHM